MSENQLSEQKISIREINDLKISYREGCHDEYIIGEIIKSGTYNKVIIFDKSDVWLDAGAHIGVFALDNFKKVEGIVCYEPAQSSFEILNTNITMNQMDNVVAINKIVIGTDDKTRKFYIGKTPMSYRMSLSGNPIRGREEFELEAENINSIIDTFGINSIKLDIEGAEYEVIKAIKDWSPINKIFMEFHLNELGDVKTKEKYWEIVNLLKSIFPNHHYKEDPKNLWHINLYFSK